MMIESNCSDSFDRIGSKVQQGNIIVFPTDTVFAVGTAPTSKEGILRLFDIKKRSLDKKMPILFSSQEEACKFVDMDERARHIARAFWPGQVTMILPAVNNLVPRVLLGQDNTLAVRVPNHECCLKLISACGRSLIGTSANFSGSNSFSDPDQPGLFEFARSADYFVRGKCGNNSLPSTIVDLSTPATFSVAREGAVSTQLIFDHLSKINKADLSPSATNS